MLLLNEIMQANDMFLAQGGAARERHQAQPRRKVAVFTCMDTRLVELLEPAMGISRGDAHVIKNAGNTIVDPQGAIVRSLVVSIFALGVEEILVVGHKDCGMAALVPSEMREKMMARGITEEAIAAVEGFEEWLGAFADPAHNVRHVTRVLRESPLIPIDVPVHGLIVEPNRGQLTVVVNGYTSAAEKAATPKS